MMVLVDFGYNLHLTGISEMKGYFTEKKYTVILVSTLAYLIKAWKKSNFPPLPPNFEFVRFLQTGVLKETILSRLW